MSQDILINKVDFQNNDLMVFYKIKGDFPNCVERAIKLDWRKCPEIVTALENLFKAIIRTKDGGDINTDFRAKFPKRFEIN